MAARLEKIRADWRMPRGACSARTTGRGRRRARDRPRLGVLRRGALSASLARVEENLKDVNITLEVEAVRRSTSARSTVAGLERYAPGLVANLAPFRRARPTPRN